MSDPIKKLLEFDLVRILSKFFNTKNEINDKLTEKADVSHNHGNITNGGKLNLAKGVLVTDDNKNIAVVNTISKDKIGDFSHSHEKVDITDFSHSHEKADISDFSHSHEKADISDFSHSHLMRKRILVILVILMRKRILVILVILIVNLK